MIAVKAVLWRVAVEYVRQSRLANVIELSGRSADDIGSPSINETFELRRSILQCKY